MKILQRKFAELDARVARVRTHRRANADELASGRGALDLVAFNLMRAVQSAGDLAAHLIADEGWTAPPTVAKCFLRLAARQVITAATATAIRKAVGFRNVVAHGYAGIDVAATHAASPGRLDCRRKWGRLAPHTRREGTDAVGRIRTGGRS